jgi:hypothetical protein
MILFSVLGFLLGYFVRELALRQHVKKRDARTMRLLDDEIRRLECRCLFILPQTPCTEDEKRCDIKNDVPVYVIRGHV